MSRPAPLKIPLNPSPPFNLRSRSSSDLTPRERGDRSSQEEISSPTTPQVSAASDTLSGVEDHCTCPPEHKIPRPENCFILFRSAHQKQLSATGGNNQPGISVKLGDAWKNADPATKAYWKAEAEKKKALHQQRYPNYKYQPRSKNKTPRSAEEQLCSNCGKRLIGQPPIDSPPPSATVPPDNTSGELSQTSTNVQSPTAKSPLHTMPPANEAGRQNPPHTRLDGLPGPLFHSHSLQTKTKRSSDSEYIFANSNSALQDPKRRRTSHASVPPPPTHGNHPPQTAYMPYPMSPGHHGPPPPPPPPPSVAYPRRHSAVMNPVGHVSPPPSMRTTSNMTQWSANRNHQSAPSRPVINIPNAPSPENATPRLPSARHSLPGIAEVMRSPLPSNLPAKTSMAPPMRRSASGDNEDNVRLAPLQRTGDSETSGDEAIATSIPFTSKIKRLSRVSPPLKGPGLATTPSNVRGVLLAIEGDDTDAAQALARLLVTSLHKEEGVFVVRMEPGPPDPNAQKKDLNLKDYLEVISTWHEKNKEMVDYITAVGGSGGRRDSQRSTAIPVLIIPNYQLRITDFYASRITITDGFSPDEHYEHMVSLWRGIVGPDLTIYLRDVPREQLKKEVVHVIGDFNAMRIAKEKGSQKVDEERIRSMRYQVGAFVRRMAGPLKEIDLGDSEEGKNP